MSRTCARPGCGAEISRKSRSGYCRRCCQMPGRKPVNAPKCANCGKRISSGLGSGLCIECFTARRRRPKVICGHPGCERVLSRRPDETGYTGMCRSHSYAVLFAKAPRHKGGGGPRGTHVKCPIGNLDPREIAANIGAARAMGCTGVEAVMLAAMLAAGVPV